jgi:hypothetical protein
MLYPDPERRFNAIFTYVGSSPLNGACRVSERYEFAMSLMISESTNIPAARYPTRIVVTRFALPFMRVTVPPEL